MGNVSLIDGHIDESRTSTLEYMKKQRDKYKRNLYNAVLRNAPKSNISDLKVKISHYEVVCKLLEETEAR